MTCPLQTGFVPDYNALDRDWWAGSLRGGTVALPFFWKGRIWRARNGWIKQGELEILAEQSFPTNDPSWRRASRNLYTRQCSQVKMIRKDKRIQNYGVKERNGKQPETRWYPQSVSHSRWRQRKDFSSKGEGSGWDSAFICSQRLNDNPPQPQEWLFLFGLGRVNTYSLDGSPYYIILAGLELAI